METWKQQGIPLHIVLRGVEKSFDSYEAKPRKRTVKTLLYCQEEIEAQFAEWVESHVGAAADSPEAETESDKTPFSFAAITEHLERSRKALSELAKSRTQEDDLSEALTRTTSFTCRHRKRFCEQHNTRHAQTRRFFDRSRKNAERFDVLGGEFNDVGEVEKRSQGAPETVS